CSIGPHDLERGRCVEQPVTGPNQDGAVEEGDGRISTREGRSEDQPKGLRGSGAYVRAPEAASGRKCLIGLREGPGLDRVERRVWPRREGEHGAPLEAPDSAPCRGEINALIDPEGGNSASGVGGAARILDGRTPGERRERR